MDESGIPKQHVFTHPSPVEHWRHMVEIVALIIAAAWGFYVFVFQERIKPASQAPVLDVRSTVETHPMQGGLLLVQISLDKKNIGPVDLKVAAIIINVYGLKYGPTMTRVDRAGPALDMSTVTNALPTTGTVLLSSWQTIYAPAGGKTHDTFAPGREKSAGPTLAVPAHDFDAVKIDYAICYTRQDDKRVLHFTPKRNADGSWNADALRQIAPAFACATSPGANVFAL